MVSALVSEVEGADHLSVGGNAAYTVLQRIGLERNSAYASVSSSLRQTPVYGNVWWRTNTSDSNWHTTPQTRVFMAVVTTQASLFFLMQDCMIIIVHKRVQMIYKTKNIYIIIVQNCKVNKTSHYNKVLLLLKCIHDYLIRSPKVKGLQAHIIRSVKFIGLLHLTARPMADPLANVSACPYNIYNSGLWTTAVW